MWWGRRPPGYRISQEKKGYLGARARDLAEQNPPDLQHNVSKQTTRTFWGSILGVKAPGSGKGQLDTSSVRGGGVVVVIVVVVGRLSDKSSQMEHVFWGAKPPNPAFCWH